MVYTTHTLCKEFSVAKNKPVITPTQDILVPPHQGLVIAVQQTRNDNSVDISANSMVFYIQGVGEFSLEANPADAEGLLINIPESKIRKISRRGASFALIDNTSGTPKTRWYGHIEREIV